MSEPQINLAEIERLAKAARAKEFDSYTILARAMSADVVLRLVAALRNAGSCRTHIANQGWLAAHGITDEAQP